MSLIESIIARAQSNKQRIVLPESLEERTLTAADKSLADDIADIILIGNPDEIFALADKLGLKVVFQEIDWNSKETELASKNIDCIWNGMTITEERAENMQISIPYMENKQVCVVKAD